MSDNIILFTQINSNVKSRMIRGLITETKGNIFSCYFKKLDGTMREMVCRRYVNKGVKGTSPYNVEKVDKSNNQLTVFDMQNDGFRKINLTEVITLKIDGVKYIFDASVSFTEIPTVSGIISDIVKSIPPASGMNAENHVTINVYLGPTNGKKS